MIELVEASFGYRGTERPALNRVNLQFAPGEFALVCGATGSGKSTLLRIMNGLAPHFTGGVLSGKLKVDGVDFTGSLPHDLASLVGFVNQQPESSFVTDTVAEELAFGMEQLGFSAQKMRAGVNRVAKLLDIEQLLEAPLAWLSGGQQQRVAIAAALAAGQKVLLLDEPTSALDPKAASEIIQLLENLAHQSGITVILVEHRIERVIELVDSIVIVGNDGLVTKGGPEQFANYQLVPPMISLATALDWTPVPVSLAQARESWLKSGSEVRVRSDKKLETETALVVQGLSVRYGSHLAVKEASFSVNRGEVVALMGPNGSGKSSLLWAIQGSGKRSGGTVSTAFGDPADLDSAERLCLLTLIPQKAADLLFLNSLADELAESDRFAASSASTTSSIFEKLTSRLDPKIHPRDLSAGQQLALVVSIQLIKGAGVLLMDEPTRGLDYAAKRALVDQLRILRESGNAVLIASHDVEFIAQVADRVVQLKEGEVESILGVSEALGVNSKNPTQVSQITQLAGVLTMDDVVVRK
jgi:energy-coupling factor transport system ATP-binding protein